jgi:hypothetical protein
MLRSLCVITGVSRIKKHITKQFLRTIKASVGATDVAEKPPYIPGRF